MAAPSSRVYVGNLPKDGVRDRDLEDHFSKYGKIKTVDIKQGFAFVEYNEDRDASDAAKELNGKEILGSRVKVELSRPIRPREERASEKRDDRREERYPPRDSGYGGSYGGGGGYDRRDAPPAYDDRRGGSSYDRGYDRGYDRPSYDRPYDSRGGYDSRGPPPGRGYDRGYSGRDEHDRRDAGPPRDRERDGGRGGYDRDRPRYDKPVQRLPRTTHRVLCSNLGEGVSWQDIKDLGKKVAPTGTLYTDVRVGTGYGVIEFSSKEEMEACVSQLQGDECRGCKVTLEIETEDRNFLALTRAPRGAQPVVTRAAPRESHSAASGSASDQPMQGGGRDRSRSRDRGVGGEEFGAPRRDDEGERMEGGL